MAPKKTLTEDELIEELQAACTAAGSQAAWATKAGVRQSYVSDVLRRRQPPGEAIYRALGYERQVTYVKRKDIWDSKK